MAADFYKHLTARINGRCYQAAIFDVLASFRPLCSVFLTCLVIINSYTDVAQGLVFRISGTHISPI
jgi:hypothetical protein